MTHLAVFQQEYGRKYNPKAKDVAKHSNKHIREAIKYAEQHGWRFEKAGGQAHIWGKLLCPLRERTGCYFNVHSTPRNPEAHARRIRRAVDDCQHS